jgi:sugar-phosphatase
MSSDREILADAAVFDMDGTLVDSTELVETVWAAFAERHGVDLAELLDYAHGRRAADTVEHALAALDYDRAAIADALAVVSEHETGVEGAVREVPGAARFVAAFDPADVALVTSAPRDLARLRMAQAGIPLPAVIVGAEDVTTGKPDPKGYLRAIELLGRTPERVAIFEDADAGLRAAIAAGAEVVVVGAYEGEATHGLIRTADYSGARVARTPEGRYRITLGDPRY